jgi:hypothetical protein
MNQISGTLLGRQKNAYAELIRDFAGSVVERTIREYQNPKNAHARAQLQGYLTGVLDCALKVGAICQSENQAAMYAVQGQRAEDYWW